jgi:hypothetical protein
MKIQPLGDMVAKIRLPLLNPHSQTVSRTQTTRGSLERLANRLLQS